MTNTFPVEPTRDGTIVYVQWTNDSGTHKAGEIGVLIRCAIPRLSEVTHVKSDDGIWPSHQMPWGHVHAGMPWIGEPGSPKRMQMPRMEVMPWSWDGLRKVAEFIDVISPVAVSA